MRVLLGGLVGAIVSAAAWFFLEYTLMKEMGWLAIGVGLVTGLCINAAAGAGAVESYGRGALAVILALVGIVGGRAAYVKVMQNVSRVTTIAPAGEEVGDAPAEKVAEPTAEGDAAPVAENAEQQIARPDGARISGTKMQKPTVNSYKEMEVVWMAVAALAAYVTGKGSGKAPPAEKNPAVPEDIPA
jgi:hypothetical protein